MKHLDQRLNAADPLRVDLEALPETAAQALMEEIRMRDHQSDSEPVQAGKDHAVVSAPVRPRRSRRRATVVALAVAAAVGIPGIAVAAYTGVHTGVFGSPGDTEDVPGEEFLQLDSPEIVDVVREVAKEYPLPAGATYDQLLARYPAKEPGVEQRSGLATEVNLYATCAWYRHWQAGNAAQRHADQPTIDAIPDWKYSASPADPDVRNQLVRISEETRAGNDATLKQYIIANC